MSWKRRALLALCIVALWQVGSWALFGRQTLEARVGGTLRRQVHIIIEQILGSTSDTPARLLLWSERGSVSSGLVHSAGAMAVDFRLSMVPVDADSSDAIRQCLQSGDCLAVSYWVHWNTPIYGDVGVMYYDRGSCDVSYGHRYLWVLGVWVPISGGPTGWC
jgi:hypothetical protein